MIFCLLYIFDTQKLLFMILKKILFMIKKFMFFWNYTQKSSIEEYKNPSI